MPPHLNNNSARLRPRRPLEKGILLAGGQAWRWREKALVRLPPIRPLMLGKQVSNDAVVQAGRRFRTGLNAPRRERRATKDGIRRGALQRARGRFRVRGGTSDWLEPGDHEHRFHGSVGILPANPLCRGRDARAPVPRPKVRRGPKAAKALGHFSRRSWEPLAPSGPFMDSHTNPEAPPGRGRLPDRFYSL